MRMSPVESVPVEQLVLDSTNSRLHPADNLEAIKASLQRFGQPESLVVKRDSNVVIAGNGRLIAMKELGWSRADVRWADCTDEEAKAYALTANRTSEMSKWDSEQLQATLDDLAGSDYEMDEFGFDDEFVNAIDDSGRVETELHEEMALETRPRMGRTIPMTQDQRDVFDNAAQRVREDGDNKDWSDGRVVELLCAEYMAGA